MKVFLFICLLLKLSAAKNVDDIDLEDPEEPLDHIGEEEFDEIFNVPSAQTKVEEEKREKALKETEKDIHEINKEFEEGQVNWYDKLNDFADLPDDEFLKEKTGDIEDGNSYGRGLLEPLEEEREDEESERYFDQFRFNRDAVPDSYSSVKEGFVSPVKNQRTCGSCVAFASTAAIETCFAKKVRVFGDYSEQQVVDCGYGQNGANGCDGAAPHAYLKWADDNKIRLAHESQYPYKNTETNYQCPNNLPFYNQGVRINGSYYTYRGDEDTLKKMVYEHGAVVATVKAKGPFGRYGGGIFSGCPESSSTDHAITIVGYGTENGTPYWLIKNSWGTGWGEKGFIRMKRGVKMCGIGRAIAVTKCETVAGPTNPPLTTAIPCVDKWSNCPALAEKYCYQEKYGQGCRKACGLCPGMTPASSYTCWDKYSNCAQLCNTSYRDVCKKSCNLCGSNNSVTTPSPSVTTPSPSVTTTTVPTCRDRYNSCQTLAKTSCYRADVRAGCPRACGQCPGQTPALSVTCYDKYRNCPRYRMWCSVNPIVKNGCRRTCNTSHCQQQG